MRRKSTAPTAQQTAEMMALFEGATGLRWKDEDLIDGQPVGPLVIVYGDGRTHNLGWQTRKVATNLAQAFRLTLEVF
jgi:hypothetical protein